MENDDFENGGIVDISCEEILSILNSHEGYIIPQKEADKITKSVEVIQNLDLSKIDLSNIKLPNLNFNNKKEIRNEK